MSLMVFTGSYLPVGSRGSAEAQMDNPGFGICATIAPHKLGHSFSLRVEDRTIEVTSSGWGISRASAESCC